MCSSSARVGHQPGSGVGVVTGWLGGRSVPQPQGARPHQLLLPLCLADEGKVLKVGLASGTEVINLEEISVSKVPQRAGA